MKQNQAGFTLIEIAIVLVIIGLLLGGVLKGQELINSAKVKNLAGDFRNIPLFIYGYQDKFRALPGDDALSSDHVSAVPATGTIGNGVIDGYWNSLTDTDESFRFWQQVRLANLASGQTTLPTGTITDSIPYFLQNAAGGRIGVESGSANPPIHGLRGSYIICSKNIVGKFAKQLDVTLDNGETNSGSMMAMQNNTTPTAGDRDQPPISPLDDATLYTVCMGV